MKKKSERKDLYEINRYEDSAFPLGIYIVTPVRIEPPGRGYQDLHWHEEPQLTLLTHGELDYQVEGEYYHLNSGEAIFINSNCVHVTTNLSRDGRYISIAFPVKMLGFFAGSRMEQENVLPYVNAHTMPALVITHREKWMREILERLWMTEELFLNRDTPMREYQISLQINMIWYLLISGSGQQIQKPVKANRQKIDRIKKMITFINENFSEPIKVADIAKAAGVSEGECSRCFHEMANLSPKQYLLDYRISYAAEALNRTDLPITQIAMDTGFGDASYFVQCFRKKMGITPKEYRDKGI